MLLGSPSIEYEGVPLEVDTRKAVALLAYPAITRRRHTRDALATLLWPEYDHTRSRAALRRTLSSLGRARAEGWLEADRESVGLIHNEIWVDADRFHDLLAGCRAHGHPEAEVCPECLPLLTEAAASPITPMSPPIAAPVPKTTHLVCWRSASPDTRRYR